VRGVRWLPLVAISIMLAGCASAGKRAAPPATPQHVVAAYFAALNAHDKTRARPLVTADFARFSFDDPHSCWFDGCVKITHLKTSKPRYDRYGADVRVRFIIDQRDQRTKSYGWSGYYCLIRKGPGAPWLIAVEGNC
jgi:uncharacterized protein YceK